MWTFTASQITGRKRTLWIALAGLVDKLAPEPDLPETVSPMQATPASWWSGLREVVTLCESFLYNTRPIAEFLEMIAAQPRLRRYQVFVSAIWTAVPEQLLPLADAFEAYDSIPSIRGSCAYYDISDGRYDDEYYEIKAHLSQRRTEAWRGIQEQLERLSETLFPQGLPPVPLS